MLNINLAKDELARQLLPTYIENLYIKFTNELINFAKLISKRDGTTNKLDSVEDSIDSEILKNLYSMQQDVLNVKINESLTRMRIIMKEIKDSKSINDLDTVHTVLSKEYSNEEIELIQSFVELRKSIYRFIEYMGVFLIKNDIKDDLINTLYIVASKSLKAFNIDEILEQKTNIDEITKLMNLVNLFISKRDINLEKIREVIVLKDNPNYSEIIELLNDSYVKVMSPNIK